MRYTQKEERRRIVSYIDKQREERTKERKRMEMSSLIRNIEWDIQKERMRKKVKDGERKKQCERERRRKKAKEGERKKKVKEREKEVTQREKEREKVRGREKERN